MKKGRSCLGMAGSTLVEGLAGLRLDAALLREEFLHGCAQAVGNRAGNWFHEVLLAILTNRCGSAGDGVPRPESDWLGGSARRRTSSGRSLLAGSDLDYGERQESPIQLSGEPELLPSLSGSTLEVIVVEVISRALSNHAGVWSPVARPLTTLLVGWLLRQFPALSLGDRSPHPTVHRTDSRQW